MSLSSSLYTGSSGLKNMGSGLQVVGNNIANTNTIGFKSSRTTFADTLYENVATHAGTAQMGRGMAVDTVFSNFNEGSMESTSNATDMAIGGDGFFMVRRPGTEQTYYTRAGNFYFNASGALVNSEGYVVQGWDVDSETGDIVGAVTDIVLDAFTSSPEASTEITAIVNLDADAESKATVLANEWSSTSDDYISSGVYEYMTVVSVYDSLGSAHDISIYYDKISNSEWEYMITCDPEEDMRNLVQGTDAEGLLAKGTINFSQSSGDITDITMEEFTGRLGNFSSDGVNTVDDLSFNIEDHEAFNLDGYGIELEYNGQLWNFVDRDGSGNITATDLPENYPNASVIYSDANTIQISFDGEDEVDLEIRLTESATTNDTIGFDINGEEDIHKQGLDAFNYDGETEDNTEVTINDASVMTTDVEGVSIVWNPVEEDWYWSNPEDAASAGTLISDVTLGGSAGTSSSLITVTNAASMGMRAEDVQVMFDGTAWDWNMPIREEDVVNEVVVPSNNTASLSVLSQGSQGAIESGNVFLTWNPATKVWDSTTSPGATTTQVHVSSSASTNQEVIFYIWDGVGNSAGATQMSYTLNDALTSSDTCSISFNLDPSPPEEYPDAVLITPTAAAGTIAVDWDGDSTSDLELATNTSGAAPAAGFIVTFDVNPDTPPAEYANATLSGDETEVRIDLDGSGGETADDIVFKFNEDLKNGSAADVYRDRSAINFNILGSTAWTSIRDSDVTSDGYFTFTADFLGGDYGTTEQEVEVNFGSSFDGNNWENDSLSTTQYASSSATTYQDSDGYAAGDLDNVSVSSDGTITGNYSNGQSLGLFRVSLAKFYNNNGLISEGGNMFSETDDSGQAITSQAGTNGLGTVSSSSLELSNVDLSDELVKMIEIQRGYQGNSKTITTVDEMLQTVINMK